MEEASSTSPSPRGHWADTTPENLLDWLIVAVTSVLLAVSVYQLGGYAPFGRPLIPVVTLSGLLLVLHGLAWLLDRRSPSLHPLGWLVLPFLAWAGLRTWVLNPAPWLGEQQFWPLLAGGAVWWTLLHHYRHREKIWTLLAVAIVTGAGTFGAALYQVWFDPTWLPLGRVQTEQYWGQGRASGTFGVPNNFAAYLSLLFPLLVLGASTRRFRPVLRVLCGLLAVAMVEGILLSISRGALLALIPVLLLLPLFVLRKSLHQVLGTLAFVAMVAGGAWWIFNEVETVQVRLDKLVEEQGEVTRKYKWQAAWSMIQDRPHLGHGLGSYEFVLDAYLPEGFAFAPRYAHNEFLNAWSDLGWPGLLLLFGPALGLSLAAWRAWGRTPILASPPDGGRRVTPVDKILFGWLALGAISFALHCLVDFHLKLPADLFLATLMFGLAAQRLTRRRYALPRSLKPVLGGLCVVMGALLAYRGTVVAHGTYEFFIAHERLNAYLEDPPAPSARVAFLERTQRHFERCLRHLPNHAEARARLGVTLLYLTRQQPENRLRLATAALAEIDTARAAASHWRFEVYRALALASLQRPATEVLAAAEAAVQAAPHQPDAWYYLAAVLSQMPNRRGDALAAAQRVLVLDHDHENALVLEERLREPPPGD